MRILYFSLDYTTHDRRFLAKMAESRHEIVFLRLHDDGIAYEKRELPAGVTEVRWRGIEGKVTPQSCLAAMPRFTRVLADVKPDLVHAGPIPTCAFMVALSGFHPLLSMSWGSDILVDARDDELARWTSQLALGKSDAFIVDCDAVRDEIRAMTGASAERFVQFPWGLDLSRFPRAPVRPRPPAAGEIVILSTRSWGEVYGIETVVLSFALAYREEPRLRLLLVGDGPLAPQVASLIDAHALGHVVRRPGRLPEEQLGRLFAESDVYLSCALSDGTSISLLEAMASGLPIVATDAPGNREWIAPHRGGFLAAPKDAPAFARALLSAARLDMSERTSLAAYNREVVEERADWHRNARRLLDAYDRFA